MSEPLGVFLVIKQFKPVGIPFRQDTFQCEVVMQDGSPLKVLMLIPDEFVAKVDNLPVAITMEGMQYIYEQGDKYFPNPEDVNPEDFQPETEEPNKTSVEDNFDDDFGFGETPSPTNIDKEWEEETEATTSDDSQWDEDWN